MDISTIKSVIRAELLSDQEKAKETEVDVAFGTDLMSDVLAFYGERNDTLLITGLTNLQTIKTAELIDISVIVFVRGKKPSEDVIERAIDSGIVLLSTELTMYETSGLLFVSGLQGINISYESADKIQQ